MLLCFSAVWQCHHGVTHVVVFQRSVTVSSLCTTTTTTTATTTPVCDTGQNDIVTFQQQENLRLVDEVVFLNTVYIHFWQTDMMHYFCCSTNCLTFSTILSHQSLNVSAGYWEFLFCEFWYFAPYFHQKFLGRVVLRNYFESRSEKWPIMTIMQECTIGVALNYLT